MAQSNSAMSIHWPRPLRSRSWRASRMPMAAFMPVTMSTMGTPSRVGGPSGWPLMLMRPLAAWMAAS